ncbi:MAG: LL-diaminopimelate aminotransferase, partial [Deltaproteobacteria bacterium]|nr:LL-diaminopimelate aminotransferase [Deltaproteobacteria bacterium]
EYLITERLISTVPWDDVERYLRFTATFVAKNEEDERRIIGELKNRLDDLGLRF